MLKISNVYDDTKKKWYESVYVLLLVGAMIGFINGFWGGGGGMLCVPALAFFGGLSEKEAHATAIFVMLPLSIASFVIYMLRGTIDWAFGGIVTSGFVLGGIIGALALKNINNFVLKIIFAVVIISGGIRLII